MLVLPCTREEKYSAKQVIDSVFVRLGDVASAALVFVGTTFVGLSSIGFARTNIVLAVTGLALAFVVGRGYRRFTETVEAGRAAPRRSATAAHW